MARWAIEWLFEELRPHDVPPTTLMWWMHRRVKPEALPPARTVLEFRHTAPKPQTIWLVLDRGEASVCHQHPGFDSDAVVTSTTADLADVFQGYRTWAEADRRGQDRRRRAAPAHLGHPAVVCVEPVDRRHPRTSPAPGRV